MSTYASGLWLLWVGYGPSLRGDERLLLRGSRHCARRAVCRWPAKSCHATKLP